MPRVWDTRSGPISLTLTLAAEEFGLEWEQIPILKCAATGVDNPCQTAMERFPAQTVLRWDYLFASPHAVETYFVSAKFGPSFVRPWHRLLAVGEGTAASLLQYNCIPDAVGQGTGAVAFLEFLRRQAWEFQNILWISAEVTATPLERLKDVAGCQVVPWPIYRTFADIEPMRKRIAQNSVSNQIGTNVLAPATPILIAFSGKAVEALRCIASITHWPLVCAGTSAQVASSQWQGPLLFMQIPLREPAHEKQWLQTLVNWNKDI